jgi:transposase InsO family protein
VIGQCRATQQYTPHRVDDEDALQQRIVELARAYGRDGYVRITVLLRGEGWPVHDKRVERIWRQESLKVPQKQPKRARLWVANGSCLRRAAPSLRIMCGPMISCWSGHAMDVRRRFKAADVQEALGELFLRRGCPVHIRSDNGPDCITRSLRQEFAHLQIAPLCIEPGSPWENGSVESFNGKFREELLNRELFYTLREAQVVIERWRRTYNQVRPHSAWGYRPPAPETMTPHPVCA